MWQDELKNWRTLAISIKFREPKIINNSDKWFFDRNEKTRENARFCALWPIFWKCQNLTSLQRSANFFFRKWQKSVQIFSSRNLNIVNACQGREIFLNAIKFGFFAYCALVSVALFFSSLKVKFWTQLLLLSSLLNPDFIFFCKETI